MHLRSPRKLKIEVRLGRDRTPRWRHEDRGRLKIMPTVKMTEKQCYSSTLGWARGQRLGMLEDVALRRIASDLLRHAPACVHIGATRELESSHFCAHMAPYSARIRLDCPDRFWGQNDVEKLLNRRANGTNEVCGE